MNKTVLDSTVNLEEISKLMEEAVELEDVNDLAWYFIKGAGGRWIVGAY